MQPKHIAVIMDGNGRWAVKNGLARTAGHQEGAEVAKKIVTRCRELNIPHLTLYTFSKENWNRPTDEIKFLFDLLTRFIRGEAPEFVKNSIKVKVLGEISRLPLAARMALTHLVEKTKDCTEMTLNLALNYSGRDEIITACKALVEQGIAADEIDEEMFAEKLYTAGQPDPDLIIRTSGEMRLSNYLLFQAAYSELYFTDTLWPDFTCEELEKAIEVFKSRERRFGKTSEQL